MIVRPNPLGLGHLNIRITLASGLLIVICLTGYWIPHVDASAQLPNLAISFIEPVQTLPSTTSLPPGSVTPFLPRVGEKFYVIVGVANLGSWPAKNFPLDVDMKWGVNQTTVSLNHDFDSLASGDVDSAHWGPFISPSQSNLTITSTVNGNHTITESNYSDNTLTLTFVVGTLFSLVQTIPADIVWNESQPQTFHYSSQYGSGTYGNRLYVMSSEAGEVVGYASDAGDVALYRNGTRILDLHLQTGYSLEPSLSPSGRFFAVGTWNNGVSVYDTTNVTNPIFSVNVSGLDLSTGVTQIAISDIGLLAVAGYPKHPTSQSFSAILSTNALRLVNITSGRIISEVNLDKLMGLGPDLSGQVDSLAFNIGNELLVGDSWKAYDSSFVVSSLLEPIPWLYMINLNGTIVWSRNLNTGIDQAFTSSDGKSIIAATQSGSVNFYARNLNTNFSLYEGYIPATAGQVWTSHIPMAISPEGDYMAVADRSNVYLLDTSGSPLFRVSFPNASSLALGGGNLAIGTTGGALKVSLWGPVDAQINAAQDAITQAKAGGADISAAQLILSQATSARSELYWYQAYSAGVRALAAAKQAPPTVTSISQTVASTATSQIGVAPPTIALSTEIAIGIAVGVAVMVGIVVVLSKRKKQKM